MGNSVSNVPGVAAFLNRLPVEFQRKLDLPWIVGAVAQADDLPEGPLVGEIQVAGIPELGCVGQVEEFRAHLQARRLAWLETLERREVQPAEGRPESLGRCATQQPKIRQRNATLGTPGNRS